MEITVERLQYRYPGGNPALDGISFTAQAGESIGLVGANGAGKSTLLSLLVGLETPEGGSILVNGQPLGEKNLAEVRRQVGYVFQDSDSQLFMNTVEEDVAFGPLNYGCTRQQAADRAARALAAVNIPHLAKRHTYQLSGGEKKLASLATVLALEPDCILLDEPSIALDPRNRRRLIEILNGLTCLKIVASHDLDLILETCDRVLLVQKGKLLADGSAAELLSDRSLLEQAGLELPLCLQGPPKKLREKTGAK